LHAGIQKFDFEGSILYFSFLPDQLIEAVFLYDPVAIRVCVAAVVFAWRSTVDANAEADRLAIFSWAENKMQISRVETENYFAGCGD
jgi:hypothetical protein